MPYSFPARRLLSASTFLILLAVLSTAACAVEMELFPGFDGVTKSTVWTPIGVKLTNPGGRAIEGTLEIRQDSPGRRTMPVCAARVSLPGSSTKLYYMYTRRHEYGGNMRVSLLRGSRILATRQLTPMTMGTNDKIVLSIGDRTSKLFFLTGEKLPLTMLPGQAPSPGRTDSTIQASAISPSMLPDRAAAYQSVDLMIVSDLGSRAPDPKSLEAIAMWVASGGTLVVSTGPNYRSFQNEFFDDLLPVTITGAGSIPAVSLNGFTGGPVAVSKSAPKPGICTDLKKTGDVPVYAARRYGSGKVIFLAFDYKASPFREWNGQADFWKNILASSYPALMVSEDLGWMQDQSGYGPPAAPSSPVSGASTLGQVVEQNPSVRTPSFNVIALYLLAYLVFLVPLNYLYLKKKRRMDLAWVSTPAVVLLFTAGAYAIGYTMKGGSIEMGIATMIEGSANSRYARTVSDASLFSPARRSYTIEIKDPYAIGQCVPQEPSEPIPTAYVGEKTAIEDVEMAMWSSKRIESVSGVDLGGVVTSRLTMAGNTVQGTVTNNTDFDLEECVIQFGSSQQEIGDLRKGGTATVNPSAGKLPPAQPYGRGGYRRDIRSRLNSLAYSSATSSGAPVLIGFADRKPLYGLAGGRGKVVAETCCIIRLDVSMGDTYVFQPNVIRAQIIKQVNAALANRTPPGVSGHLLSMQMSPGGTFSAAFQLPEPGGMELTQLNVGSTNSYVYNGGGTPSLMFYLLNKKGVWEQIKTPNGGTIANPGKYLHPGNRIMVKVESKDGNEVMTSLFIAAMARRK